MGLEGCQKWEGIKAWGRGSLDPFKWYSSTKETGGSWLSMPDPSPFTGSHKTSIRPPPPISMPLAPCGTAPTLLPRIEWEDALPPGSCRRTLGPGRRLHPGPGGFFQHEGSANLNAISARRGGGNGASVPSECPLLRLQTFKKNGEGT
uniref:Uncharacterized protein n=1 Tax=Sphaerodactylus townsendi TaxID=933632 RepID=A0ACB8EL55_9SAUR